MKGRVRPERPIAVATIASQQAITASPVSAATAALIAILGAKGIGLIQILAICVPATLLGVIVAALIQTRIGVELDQDPEYRRRVAAGELKEDEISPEAAEHKPLPARAPLSAWMFMLGVALVVCGGLFPILRTVGYVETPAAQSASTVVRAAPTTTTAGAGNEQGGLPTTAQADARTVTAQAQSKPLDAMERADAQVAQADADLMRAEAELRAQAAEDAAEPAPAATGEGATPPAPDTPLGTQPPHQACNPIPPNATHTTPHPAVNLGRDALLFHYALQFLPSVLTS
jgi:hypothetical protein